MKMFFGALLTGLCVFASDPLARSRADDDLPVAEGGQAIQRIQLAHQLIQFGRANSNPEALLLAAQILHRNSPQVDKEVPEGAEAAPADDSKLADLVVEARAMRPTDKLLGDLAQRTAEELKEASRGATVGFQRLYFRIPAKKTATKSFQFNGKKQSVIYATTMTPKLGTSKTPVPVTGPADMTAYSYNLLPVGLKVRGTMGIVAEKAPVIMPSITFTAKGGTPRYAIDIVNPHSKYVDVILWVTGP